MEAAPLIAPAPEENVLEPAHASPGALVWRRLKTRKTALVGGFLLFFLYGGAIFAGFLAPYGYERQDRKRFFHPPTYPRFSSGKLVIPQYTIQTTDVNLYQLDPTRTKPVRFFVRGEKYKLVGLIPWNIHLFGSGDPDYPIYLFGTDEYGRDVFSRVLFGSQISLSIGLIGITISYLFGLIAGAISGYFAGWTDTIIMRFCELILSIPALYLIISLRSIFPPDMSSGKIYALIIVILSFIGWAGSARVIRGMTLSLRERQYVLAARALGQDTWRIITRHIWPGTFSYVIVAATLSIPYYILGEVVLSFLGVGIREPDPSWGIMLSAAQNTEYLKNYPWLLAPGAAIFITVLAFNFLGDGLRDAVDTKS